MERKRIYTFILLSISLFLLLPSVAHAQRKQKVQPTKPDTVTFFRGVAVGVDVVGPAMKALSSYGQYEALLRVNLQDKYYPVLEIGVGEANKTDDNTSTQFKTRAPYGRVGIDFNVLKDKHDAYRVLAGGRVGYTSFKYDVSAPAVTTYLGQPSAFWWYRCAFAPSLDRGFFRCRCQDLGSNTYGLEPEI